MTGLLSQSGGATVGRIADLAAVEVGAVLCLRACATEEPDRDWVSRDISGLFGAEEGQTAFDCVRQICGLCAQHGRRPLMCHGMGCACLGADEACLARLVAAASGADREDAMLIAVLMVRADIAPYLVMLAESMGLAIRRLAHLSERSPTTPLH